MPGIEFVGADTGDDAGEDVLGTGPRRPVPRWVWIVAALAVVAVGVGALVSARSGDAPDARPGAAPSVSASASLSPAGPVDDEPGPGAQISVLTSDGTSLFWVAGNRLFRAGPVGRASVSVPISPAGGEFAELQLVPDPAERTIWVVSRGENDRSPSSGSVEGFSTTDLTAGRTSAAPALIDGAASFGGGLYLLSGGYLLRATARGSGLTRIAAVDDGQAHGLVAAGQELQFVEGSAGNAVGRWSPSSGVGRPVPIATTDSSLAVVGATTFVVGVRAGRRVVDTLRPSAVGGGVDQRGVATGLSGVVQLVATGASALIVLGTGPRGLQFSCIGLDDPPPRPAGVQALATAVSANVAVLRGEVFQAVGSTVRPVSFGDNVCPA